MRATGNVVFVTSDSRIAAERDRVQHQDQAPARSTTPSGIASIGEPTASSRACSAAQEPDVFFYGETIEKIGPEDVPHHARRLHDLRAADAALGDGRPTSVTLTLENTRCSRTRVLKVKDVPVFYLPAMYYPINKEDRATGFLMPIYGVVDDQRADAQQRVLLGDQPQPGRDASTTTGYSKTGQGFGGEYRYVADRRLVGQRPDLRRCASTRPTTISRTAPSRRSPASHSYQITAALTQTLPRQPPAAAATRTTSRACVAQQRYQQNIFEATNRSAASAANVSGDWGANSVSGTVDRRRGLHRRHPARRMHRVAAAGSRSAAREKPIGGLPIYFGAHGGVRSRSIRTVKDERRRRPNTA